MKIYTIGSSNRSIEEFLAVLDKYQIGEVADVRSFPASRFLYFQRENLISILQKRNISYLYLGDYLGGFRKGGYGVYMQSDKFKDGLQMLEEASRKKKVTVMCSERFAWRCHRRLIGRKLKERGWQVIHIIDEQRIWEDKR